MRRSKQRGLSLVEILVVVAILGILIALLLGVIGRFQGRAKIIGCANHLRSIGLAIQSYAMTNSNYMPRAVDQGGFAVWMADIQPYLDSKKVFLCPSDFNPYTISYVTPGTPRAMQGTFSNVLVENASFTFTRLPYPSYGNSSSHRMAIRFSIPSIGYVTNVTTNSTSWVSGSSIVVTPPPGQFVLSDIKMEISGGGVMTDETPGTWSGYSHGYRNILEWKTNGVNPYTRDQSGYFAVWGVVLNSTTIIYNYVCGTSEWWFYPTCFYEPTVAAYPDVEAHIRSRVGVADGQGTTDNAFMVRVAASNMSGAPVGRMGDISFEASYGYNSLIQHLKRDAVADNTVVVIDYQDALCKPTSDPVTKIAQRHAKRFNILRMDGSVESVTLSDVLTNGTTFTSGVWQP